MALFVPLVEEFQSLVLHCEPLPRVLSLSFCIPPRSFEAQPTSASAAQAARILVIIPCFLSMQANRCAGLSNRPGLVTRWVNYQSILDISGKKQAGTRV